MESLQELVVRRARELGGREGALSTRALADAAHGKVSRGVFQKIMAGEYDAKLTQRVIDGLAEALQVPLKHVERAAGAPPSYGPFHLGEDAARLTPTQRRAVKQVVEAMLEPGAVAVEEPARARLPSVDKQRSPRQQPAKAARTGVNRGKALQDELDRQAETFDPAPEDSL